MYVDGWVGVKIRESWVVEAGVSLTLSSVVSSTQHTSASALPVKDESDWMSTDNTSIVITHCGYHNASLEYCEHDSLHTQISARGGKYI